MTFDDFSSRNLSDYAETHISGQSSKRDLLTLNHPLSNDLTSYVNRVAAITNIAKSHKSSREYTVPAGMPLSVWEDKYSRRKEDGTFQTWSERLREVVLGNAMLDMNLNYSLEDFKDTLDLAVKGVIPFSGRHLQHGDINQPQKNIELFTNCSTALFCFTSFWLLLNGSGVGADYSSFTRRINFSRYMPHIRLVLDGGQWDDGNVESGSHADFTKAITEFHGGFETKRDATHKYPPNSEDVRWFEVEDSREGWVKIMEIIETAAWQEKHADKVFIFDFSKVREAGQPIKGQQNRPASGPLPLMRALAKIANLKGMPNMAPWKQAMFIDHYLAACVALGGVRRAARMATKSWRDNDVIDFIEIKRGGFLWSANISITVDREFWAATKDPRSHAWRVFQAATAAQYYDGTGEPGFLNIDSMNTSMKGADTIDADNYINVHSKLKVHDRTKDMMGKILGYVKSMKDPFIVNPCGEIVLAMWGAYCVIGDICLAQASKEEALRAASLVPQCLIRVNTMNALYSAEVKRTNRIGVALTGIHEFAAREWDLSFRDMVNTFDNVSPGYTMTDEKREAGRDFWNTIKQMRDAAMHAADEYSDKMGMNHPHTYTTIKPSGTVSKVMACTEGAHLPAVAHYMRWVQQPILNGNVPNPALQDYKDRGYPIKDISHMYHNYMVVGFPTKMGLADTLGDRTVTAYDASTSEQFEWLRLIEKFWFGTDENGKPENNQVSYTMKYRPEQVSYQEYMKMLQEGLSTVRACAIMPIVDMSAYAYQPEEQITAEAYKAAMDRITDTVKHEVYDEASLNCANGVCSIDESINVSMA
jgi:adenosylcobalamin-dependent ribonucleoside-triphosphate reductase